MKNPEFSHSLRTKPTLGVAAFISPFAVCRMTTNQRDYAI